MRIQILMRLFLNPENKTYLREMVKEFGASPGQLREELNHLSGAEILQSERVGRQIFYQANKHHSLFPELNSMVRKAMGMDRILDSIVGRLGNLQKAVLIDDYAEGRDSGLIDLVLLGKVDHENLRDLTRKTEKHIGRRIRTLVYELGDVTEFNNLVTTRPHLQLWERGRS